MSAKVVDVGLDAQGLGCRLGDARGLLGG